MGVLSPNGETVYMRVRVLCLKSKVFIWSLLAVMISNLKGGCFRMLQ